MRNLALVAIAAGLLVSACSTNIEIPTGFPTPPPKQAAEPLPKIDLKRDAELEAALSKIAEAAKGKVGIAAILLDTGDAALVNGDQRFPMQSVYKLPISMAIMEQVRLEKLDLDAKIGVSKDDMVRAGIRSPLRDANPNGGEFTIRELIRLSVVESDGTASDVLMGVAGGAGAIQTFLAEIGIDDLKVVNTEKEIGRDWQTQYANYSTPLASAELLRWLDAANSAEAEDTALTHDDGNIGMSKGVSPLTEFQTLTQFMADSNPGAKRLKGKLPAGTYAAHKTGTSGTQNGITAATNDVGIIRLPNGKRFVIAVFVSDSPADEKTREAVIANAAKAGWDRWNR